MCCTRCREVKKDVVRVSNLIICSNCINLIVLEWDIRTHDTLDSIKHTNGYALWPCSALPSELWVNGVEVAA